MNAGELPCAHNLVQRILATLCASNIYSLCPLILPSGERHFPVEVAMGKSNTFTATVQSPGGQSAVVELTQLRGWWCGLSRVQ